MKLTKDEKEIIIHCLAIAHRDDADSLFNNRDLMEYPEFTEEIKRINRNVRLFKRFAKNWGYDFLPNEI